MKLNLFLEKFVKICLYIAPLFLLVFYQKTIYPFITFKTYGFSLVIELMVIAWVILAYREPRFRPKITPITKAVFLFLVAVTISGLLGGNPMRSLWSTPERDLGIIALWHFFAYYLALTVAVGGAAWKKYMQYVFWIGVAAALFALLQIVAPGVFYTTVGSRAGGTTGNPTYLAGYLLTQLFLGYQLIRSSKGGLRIAYGIGALIMFIAFVNANTRGAILGLAAGLFFVVAWLAYRRYKTGGGFRKIVISGAALLIIFAGIAYATHDSPVWKHIPGINRFASFSASDLSIANRFIAWEVALKGFVEHPVLGAGFENFRSVSDAHYEPRLFRGGLSETYFDKPHNVPLEILATTGVLGFAAYLWLLYVVWRRIEGVTAEHQYRVFARAAFIAYIVQSLFLFDTFGTYLNLFIGLAAVVCFSSKIEQSHLSAKSNRMALVAAGLSVPVCLVLATAHISVLRGNLAHYQMLNNMVQDRAPEAIAAYERANDLYYPFKILLSQDLLTSIASQVQQVTLPNAVQFLERALADAEASAQNEPQNYFLRISIADARTVFYRINPKYLVGIDEDIAKAEMISPNRQQTLFVRAKAKVLQGDKNGAFEDMRAAIALDPLSPESHWNYALMLVRFSTGGEALAEFSRAIELGRAPGPAFEYAMLGGIFGDAEQYEKAYAFFKRASELEPTNKEYLLKYGLVSYYMGKRDEARDIFLKLLEMAPEVKQSTNWPQLKEIFESVGITGL